MLPVVEAGAFHLLLVERKAQRLDQVQGRAGREAGAAGIAGIPVNLGMDEDDVDAQYYRGRFRDYDARGPNRPWRRTMKRGLMLGLLAAIGSVVMVAAQQPTANAPKVVDVEKINDSLYVLRGNGGGGNTAVLIMANGVAVVDAKNPGGDSRFSPRSRS